MKRLTPADKEAIKLKHSQGTPGAELAREYSVSESTICYTWKEKWAGREKIPCPKCGEPMQTASSMCQKCYLASVKGSKTPPATPGRARGRPKEEGNTIIPSIPRDRTFTSTKPRGLPPGATERAYCERSPYPEKAHYFKLDNFGKGKCEYCGKVHGS